MDWEGCKWWCLALALRCDCYTEQGLSRRRAPENAHHVSYFTSSSSFLRFLSPGSSAG